MRKPSRYFVIAHKGSFCFRFAESYVKVCEIKFFCFSLHDTMVGLHCRRKQTRVARKGMRVMFTEKGRSQTLSSTSRLRNSDYTEKITAMKRPR